MKEEHIVRRMLDVDITGKRRRGRPNLRWTDACKRDITEGGSERGQHDKQGSMEEKLISYTGDPRWRDKSGMKRRYLLYVNWSVDVAPTHVLQRLDTDVDDATKPLKHHTEI